jgi:hypothetical protein
MTTDADLALNTDLLADDPEIATMLQAAGFENKHRPGHWENRQGIALDLMVAPHQSNRKSATARAADLGPHAKTVARIGPGLAPALTDNSLRVIRALDPSDSRTPEIRVAGPAALLIAKTIKIGDRLDDASRGDLKRIVDKDTIDVLRLLQACPTAELSEGLALHEVNTPAYEDVVRGLRILRERATETQHALPALAERASRGDPTVAPSFVVLVLQLLTAVST